jgi:hypothetical protein
MTDVYGFGNAETRLVRENVYGVTPSSPTYRRLNGIGFVLHPAFVVNEVRIPGALIPTGATVDDDFTMGSYQGRIDFNGMVAVWQSLLGNAAVTSLGGSPEAFQWLWEWDGRRPTRPNSYAAFSGYPDSAWQMNGLILASLSLGGGRPDGFEVSGNCFAKAAIADQLMGGITREVQQIAVSGTVSGGTYTVTIVEANTGPTAAIAHNANAATVQAAIDALPGIRAGDVVVAGGPLPGTPLTVTYDGPVFAGENVAQLTVDSGSLTGGGSYVASTTTPGVDAVSDVPLVPAGAVLGNAYLDTTWAALGTGQLLHLYNQELEIADRFGRVQPTNKSKSSDAVTDMAEQSHTLALTLGYNATLLAQLARMRSATKVFVRSEWEGDTISGANKYLQQIDSCLQFVEWGEPENAQETLAYPLTGALAIDQTANRALRVKLVNTLASL